MNDLQWAPIGPPSPASPPPLPPAEVAFTGDRNEFRKMVTRGAALELVTFGFYRFWVATGARRHLWSNTVIDGDAPEYTGTAKELLGTHVRDSWPSSPTIRVRIEGRDELGHVRLSSSFLPVHISGVVERGKLMSDTELAVAVNGRIHVLTRAFSDWGTLRFLALVPAMALIEGANRVEVFAIESRGPARLVWSGSS